MITWFKEFFAQKRRADNLECELDEWTKNALSAQIKNSEYLNEIQDLKEEIKSEKEGFEKDLTKLRDELALKETEGMEFLTKLKEINEEKDMIKKLCRKQATELIDEYKLRYAAEETAKEATQKLTLYEQGLVVHEGEIKALSLCKIQNEEGETKETWAPVVFTLNKEGTQILKREAKPDTERKYAIENAKISFIELFDQDHELSI